MSENDLYESYLSLPDGEEKVQSLHHSETASIAVSCEPETNARIYQWRVDPFMHVHCKDCPCVHTTYKAVFLSTDIPILEKMDCLCTCLHSFRSHKPTALEFEQSKRSLLLHPKYAGFSWDERYTYLGYFCRNKRNKIHLQIGTSACVPAKSSHQYCILSKNLIDCLSIFMYVCSDCSDRICTLQLRESIYNVYMKYLRDQKDPQANRDPSVERVLVGLHLNNRHANAFRKKLQEWEAQHILGEEHGIDVTQSFHKLHRVLQTPWFRDRLPPPSEIEKVRAWIEERIV